MLAGKRVLVTGASGSIGSALARPLRESGVARLTGIDLVPGPDVLRVDIRDRMALRHAFHQIRPEIVFHAAALKHVPELESEPVAALQTNVFGTANLACVCRELAVETVVHLSTDKAVQPVSIMGKTKQLAEAVITSMEGGNTRWVVVRFGNVLGSSGSVQPIFLDQIRRGGPITVTHPEMQRYFLTTESAVAVLLASARLARSGQICIPEMGEPRSILSLANEMMAERPVPIVFSGVRPGEKLTEILWDPFRERLVRKESGICFYEPVAPHYKIWAHVEALRRSCGSGNASDVRQTLWNTAQENPES